MWYVVQVRTGTEERTRLQCQAKIPGDVLERCFIFYYEEKKRIGGKWITQKKVLYPGYIFVVTEDVEKLYEQLKNIGSLTKLIGTGETIVPLSQKEVDFLKGFGGEDQIVGMSEGIIEQSKVMITSGPLQGIEGFIKKIDRHKRKAYLEIPMFGKIQNVQVGLEIVAKTV